MLCLNIPLHILLPTCLIMLILSLGLHYPLGSSFCCSVEVTWIFLNIFSLKPLFTCHQLPWHQQSCGKGQRFINETEFTGTTTQLWWSQSVTNLFPSAAGQGREKLLFLSVKKLFLSMPTGRWNTLKCIYSRQKPCSNAWAAVGYTVLCLE